MVWVIRKLRPDIIFTRFPPDARAGHGHHSASAVLAIEAFKAAADPNRFPEQLKLGWTYGKQNVYFGILSVFLVQLIQPSAKTNLNLKLGIIYQLLAKVR